MAFRSIKGAVAMVTGASSGLGRATAERLVQQGARVAILDLPSTNGAEVAKTIGSDKCIFTPADVTSVDDVSKALDKLVDKFGSLQVLVNCAGTGCAKRVFDKRTEQSHDLDLFNKVISVNVSGTFNVIRLAVPVMRNNDNHEEFGRGVIVNTASIAAFDGQIGQVAYAASKGAIVSMNLSLARDLAGAGIRVNTIAPGLFDTQLLANLPERVKTLLANQVPFPKRLGNAEEFAHLAQAIIENNMMNGEVIRLDGSLRMMP